jgi:hypothetical protein
MKRDEFETASWAVRHVRMLLVDADLAEDEVNAFFAYSDRTWMLTAELQIRPHADMIGGPQ